MFRNDMKTSFYTETELAQLGLNSFGHNVLISRYAQIYSPNKINIGDNVRIDDFCILSGNITIGSHIHIGPYCALYGGENGIEMKDYTGLSARVTIYSAIDDFSGTYLIGPIHDSQFTNVTGGHVILHKYSQIGAGSMIFPGVIVCEGAVLGAMSMTKRDLAPWTINAGVPAIYLKERKKELLKYVLGNEC